MKTFELKVSDLLNTPGSTDTVSFEGLHNDQITNLSDTISWEITLHSLSESIILVTIKNIKTKLKENCDRCLEDFDTDIQINKYVAKFMIPDDYYEDAKLDDEEDEIFPINPRSNMINIQDMLTQSILLKEEISQKCPKCIEETKDEIDTDEENEDNYYTSSSNISFS